MEDNIVIELFKNDPTVFNVLLLSAYACLKHPKKTAVMIPMMESTTANELEKKLEFQFENYSDLIKILEKCDTDSDVQKVLNKFDYKFIKFLITSSKMNLKSNFIFDDGLVRKKCYNLLELDDILTIQIFYDQEVEKKFNTSQPKFLIHGSPLSNWYSILRNGLKNLSRTVLQANGSVHGQGVYLSNSFEFSMHYGQDRYCKTKLIVYGVVQILGDKEEYKKTGNIYVINDDSKILLRYLVIVPQCKTGNLKDINTYFLSREFDIAKSALSVCVIQAKRLGNDKKKMTKICEKNEFSFEEKQLDDKVSWIIDNDVLKLHAVFDTDYPSIPPFIYVLETTYTFDINVDDKKNESKKKLRLEILQKGAIYYEKLTTKKWSSKIKVYKLIKRIIEQISEMRVKKCKKKVNDYNESYGEFIKYTRDINMI